MDDLGLGNVCGLLFALLDTKEDQCDADAAAKARKPKHNTVETLRAWRYFYIHFIFGSAAVASATYDAAAA